MIARLIGLARARDGNAGLEFALGAPLLFLAMFGIIELAMITLVTVLMEGGLREASRYGITGYVAAGTTRQAQIQAIIATDTLGLLDMSKLQITTEVYSSFSQIGQPGPDPGVAGLGNAGDIVLYRLTYPWPLMTQLMVPILGTNGIVTLSASMAVRNEPYGGP